MRNLDEFKTGLGLHIARVHGHVPAEKVRADEITRKILMQRIFIRYIFG